MQVVQQQNELNIVAFCYFFIYKRNLWQVITIIHNKSLFFLIPSKSTFLCGSVYKHRHPSKKTTFLYLKRQHILLISYCKHYTVLFTLPVTKSLSSPWKINLGRTLDTVSLQPASPAPKVNSTLWFLKLSVTHSFKLSMSTVYFLTKD